MDNEKAKIARIRSNREKQFNFASDMERRAFEYEMRTGRSAPLNDFSCSCRTCGESRMLHCGSSVEDWLRVHSPDHDTWVEYMGKNCGFVGNSFEKRF